MIKNKDNRKRIRCKCCGKRVNLVYKKVKDKMRFFCPNCGGHGEVKYKRERNLKTT